MKYQIVMNELTGQHIIQNLETGLIIGSVEDYVKEQAEPKSRSMGTITIKVELDTKEEVTAIKVIELQDIEYKRDSK